MPVDAHARTTGGVFYSEVSCLRPGYDDIPPAWASGVSIQKNVPLTFDSWESQWCGIHFSRSSGKEAMSFPASSHKGRH